MRYNEIIDHCDGQYKMVLLENQPYFLKVCRIGFRGGWDHHNKEWALYFPLNGAPVGSEITVYSSSIKAIRNPMGEE